MNLSSLPRFLGLALLLGSLPAEAQQGPLPVDVARPLSAEIVDWHEFTGRFEAVDRVDLRARVSGYLQEVLFKDGQQVKKGDVLFVVDPRPFEATYALGAAELRAAEADLTLARAELDRSKRLIARGTIPESELDARVADELRAKAQVAIAEARLREAGLNLEFTEVKAPMSGVISDAQVDVGNLVVSSESLLATIIVTNPIYLTFSASEADFLKYTRLSASGERPSSRNNPSEVQARLIDEPDWTHTGAMDFVASELDPGTGTIRGRAVFENTDDLLAPGLFARLRVVGSGVYEALLLPGTAILSDQAQKIVMVVDAEGNVAGRAVQPGPKYRGLTVIQSGLEPTDLVIVAGVQRARPGGKVVPNQVTIEFDE